MYTTYYGFSAKPFQLSPDPRFFFGSSGHKRALAYLRYGLNQGEGFITITGGIGTGKTTLVRSLLKELDAGSMIAAQIVSTQLEADDLLRMVVTAFGLSHENLSKASLIKRLEDFLRTCSREGKRVLLLVDEAQNLPARSLEELRMLSNFQVSETPLLQSFLLGQEEFRDTLQSPEMRQLRQRVIASCHLNPLNEQETRDYIGHRLHIVGWQGNPRFTEQAYAAIYHCTQGIPRQINLLCDRILLYGFLEELHEFSEANITTVSRELFQESTSASTEMEFSSSSYPDRQSSFIDPNLNQRLAELEKAVAALTQSPHLQGDGLQEKRLIRRIDELEPTVNSLQERFSELTEAIERSLGAKINHSR